MKEFTKNHLRLSDRVLYALELALEQQDLDLAEVLNKALELAMTRNSGGGEFIERRDFPKEIEVGMQFEGGPEEGDEDEIVIYRVTEIADDKVVLDGNHPLAGMALIFTCTVTAIRPASAEELEHGHVHNPDDDEETCH